MIIDVRKTSPRTASIRCLTLSGMLATFLCCQSAKALGGRDFPCGLFTAATNDPAGCATVAEPPPVRSYNSRVDDFLPSAPHRAAGGRLWEE